MPSFTSKTVLVVDDDPLLVTVLTHILEGAGYRVISAENGRRGLEAFRAAPHCDVAIADRAMPEMSGEEMAIEIRKQEPDFPIILITGCREAIARPELYNAILIKPFQSDALLDCLAKLLGIEPQPRTSRKMVDH